MSADASRRSVERQALLDVFPLVLPAVPFGFVFGVAVVESPMPDGVGLLSSVVIFAGAAQLALVTLVGTATIWAAVATALVINARHIMYSAALAPVFRDQPRWFRWLAPIMLIDQAFALAIRRTDDPPHVFRRYYGVVVATLLGAWLVANIAGIFLGNLIPESWQLGFAPAVMFLGLVVLALDRRPAVVAAVVGAVVCFATLGLPNRTGLLIGALAGVVAGALADREDAERTGAAT